MGEGWNIKNDCWLVIAYIGAAYKNREGSPASLFRRCGTSDVRAMNIRNGNSNSAAAPVRPLDPMESEEWSATSLSLSLSLFLTSFYLLSLLFPIYFLSSSLCVLLLFCLPCIHCCFFSLFASWFLSSLPCYRLSRSSTFGFQIWARRPATLA